MATTGIVALTYTTTRCRPDRFQGFAVSDFLGYRTMVANRMPLAELQKTWALYLKWKALANTDGRYSSANGKTFDRPVRVFYTAGPNRNTAPTIHATNIAGASVTDLRGVGQCEYFAMGAYADLKIPARGGQPAPIVQKIATPGHNWVLVNGDAANQNDFVCVDYWLFAMGIPRPQCICLTPQSLTPVLLNMARIDYIKTWDPNTGIERPGP